MKWYVVHIDGSRDGPFGTEDAAKAHCERCEYDIKGIKYELQQLGEPHKGRTRKTRGVPESSELEH